MLAPRTHAGTVGRSLGTHAWSVTSPATTVLVVPSALVRMRFPISSTPVAVPSSMLSCQRTTTFRPSVSNRGRPFLSHGLSRYDERVSSVQVSEHLNEDIGAVERPSRFTVHARGGRGNFGD